MTEREQQRHDLAVIDAAVRGAADSRPEDAALTDFALRISAARAIPNDGFRRELDERFGAAPDAKPAPALKKRKSRLPLFTAGVGAAASLVIAIAIVGSSQTDGLNSVQSVSSGSSASPVEEKAFAPAQSQADSTKKLSQNEVVPTARSDSATSQSVAPPMPGPRKVTRSAELTLATSSAKVEDVSDDVIRITDQFGGYVGNSTVTGGDGGNANATFDLQLPATKFQAALAQLSKLAHVRARTQNTQDITGEYRGARRQLDSATARVERIKNKLAKAEPGSTEAAALKRQLVLAEAGVHAYRAEFKRQAARVNYVGLAVEVVADNSAAADDRGTLARAVDTAGSALTAIAAVLIVALAIGLPVALIGLAVWAIVKRTRRANRDGAVDAGAEA
ncbi:MAG: DUF4349 domain-containing protein [Solirubrobacterales bacterium]